MGKTIIQKIFEKHSQSKANVDEIIDIDIDVRVARDFGGANVVKNLEENNLEKIIYQLMIQKKLFLHLIVILVVVIKNMLQISIFAVSLLVEIILKFLILTVELEHIL